MATDLADPLRPLRPNPHRHRGRRRQRLPLRQRLFDDTTGATKFGARYYDPNTGRFTHPTPAGRSKTPMHTQVTTPTITGIQTGLVSATS